MSTQIKLEQFTGPLDLLLQLIEQEKLNITEIALSKVTEQYFEHLNKLGENRQEELADFLVIATKLVYMKSRELLPYLAPEEDEGPSLADQLRMYKRYVEASRKLNALWGKNLAAYGRLEPPLRPETFILPANAAADDLRQTFLALLRRIRPIPPLPKTTIDHAVSIKEKIDTLRRLLNERRQINFMDMFSGSSSRTEIIVSFLALLELVKNKQAAISQKNSYADISINKV